MVFRPMVWRILGFTLLTIGAFLAWSFRHIPTTGVNRRVEFSAAGCSLWLPSQISWKQEEVMGGEILAHISLLQESKRVGEVQRWSIADIEGFLSQSQDNAYGSFLSYKKIPHQQHGCKGIRLSYCQVAHNGGMTWGEEIWLWVQNSTERVRVVIHANSPNKPSLEWYNQTAAILNSIRLSPPPERNH